MSTKELDCVIWKPDLVKMLGVGPQCIRVWVKSGKLPKPDVDISMRTKGWRMSSLRAAGINLVYPVRRIASIHAGLRAVFCTMPANVPSFCFPALGGKTGIHIG